MKIKTEIGYLLSKSFMLQLSEKKIQTYFAFNCLFRMQFIVAIENISIFALSIVTNANP